VFDGKPASGEADLCGNDSWEISIVLLAWHGKIAVLWDIREADKFISKDN
jgi:hypothetical protein